MSDLKHEWICSECDSRVLFRQPERPQHDYNSEMNDDGPECNICGGDMYFDEVGES